MTREADEARLVAAVRGLFAALDVADFEGARRRLAPVVDLDYVGLLGGTPQRLSADEVVRGWRETVPGLDALRHELGDPRPAVGGAAGMVVCPVEISHFLDHRRWRLVGLYRLGLTRSEVWRIGSITLEIEREEGDRNLIAAARSRAARARSGAHDFP